MSKVMAVALVAGLSIVLAVPALAAEAASARDVQAAVDSYVASAGQDANLVGGPGSAGYDAGFWIRGGDFSLRINATLQARYEAILWDALDPGSPGFADATFGGGGDRSGFSLPRAVLKFSGTAPCSTRYYIELDFGHPGQFFALPAVVGSPILGPAHQSNNLSNTREAWIEWGSCPELNIRMGQIELPATRQLLTDPALQQFVDISLASSFVGRVLPGYTDRNRDFGIMFHGAFGCEGEFSYMFAITNGDSGDSIRNILDGRTDDNLSFSGRLNWAFLNPTGYEEGALRQNTCDWYGELGAWAYYHADRRDYAAAGTDERDYLLVGGDLQLGYGGFSMTAAFTYIDAAANPPLVGDVSGWTALAQIGYLFPDTAWEIAVRGSVLQLETDPATVDGQLWEYGAAVNYYLNGHSNKMTLDAAFVSAQDPLVGALANHVDLYPGYAGGYQIGATDNDVLMFRFQWQLAL